MLPMRSSSPHARFQLWMPLWVLAALVAIFQTGFMPLYSTRTLGVAWEMWNSGQFLVPYSNGEPYSHKAPLLFWLIHAGWAIGGVGDVWPRLLEVLIGFGVLVLARRLARVLFRDSPLVSELTPWLLSAFSFSFLFSLQIMYETLLALCVLGALNALVGRDLDRKPAFVWFALAVGAGLLCKGPVMLLHIVFPLLLGPLWHPWARRSRMRWYAHGGLALLAGCAALLAWAIPAGLAGGEVYRNELFFMQTAGRVVDSFDHARPLWWYASIAPALLLPWLLWPRAWKAMSVALGQRHSSGMRLVACWLIPVVIGFSMVSSKQAYYLIPELSGLAILLAAGFARLARTGGRPSRAWGAWPLALATFIGAGALLILPHWVVQAGIASSAAIDLATASPWFAIAGCVFGALLLLTPRNDAGAVRHISTIAILSACVGYSLFAQTIWPRFDLRPAAERISVLQQAGIPVAHFQIYENQFQYLGRLTRPLEILQGGTLEAWAMQHPQGRVVHNVSALNAADLAHAELVQPFRSSWLLIERVDSFATRRRGQVPPLPAQPADRFPVDFWPYRALLDAMPTVGAEQPDPAAQP